VRLADWPRHPYLNDELREWIGLHLQALSVEEVAIYAQARGPQDEERRILVATEIGLLDGWYAPRDSTARYVLRLRLYPWQQVRGVELEAQTARVWAREHESRWQLRLARPTFEAVAEDAVLGRALAEFAAACSVMADPAGQAVVDELPRQAPIQRQPFSVDGVTAPIRDAQAGNGDAVGDDDPLGLRGPVHRTTSG
jgi:hypothetical protein